MRYVLDANQASKPPENCSAATVANKKTDGIRKIKIKARCLTFILYFARFALSLQTNKYNMI